MDARRSKSWLFATSLLVSLFTTSARADKVYLVGGSLIEGKAVRNGDKVTVELAAGSLSLAASSVLRIEPGTPPLERLAARRAALPAGAIQERLVLADAYRSEGLLGAERELLREILAIDTNHEQARARLGFVRSERGWVDGAQQLLAQGYVKRGDSWLSPAQVAELAKAELERQTAELERQKAEAELRAKRVELATAQLNSQRPPEPSYPWFASYGGYPVRGPHPGHPSVAPAAPAPERQSAVPFINGVRDPRSYFP